MASGARWRMTGSKQFVAKATAYSDTLETLGAQVVVNAARLGAETMQDVISSSGTGWDGRLGPADGRIDSGAMLSDVTYDKRARAGGARLSGRTSRSARFGWLRRFRDYYGYQEEGFVNVLKNEENRNKTWVTGSGGWTEGMGAYATAYYVAREYFRSEIRRITRRTWGR